MSTSYSPASDSARRTDAIRWLQNGIVTFRGYKLGKLHLDEMVRLTVERMDDPDFLDQLVKRHADVMGAPPFTIIVEAPDYPNPQLWEIRIDVS